MTNTPNNTNAVVHRLLGGLTANLTTRFLSFFLLTMLLPIGSHAQTLPAISPAGSSKPSKSGSVDYYFNVVSPRDGHFDINVVNSSNRGENGGRTVFLKANVPYALKITGRKEQRPTPKGVKFTASGLKQPDKTAEKRAADSPQDNDLNGDRIPKWRNPRPQSDWEKERGIDPKRSAPQTSNSNPTRPDTQAIKNARLEAQFQKLLVGTWHAGPMETQQARNRTSRIEFRPDGSGCVTIHSEYKHPTSQDHWDFSFDFTYRSRGGGVWDAQFGPVKTHSGGGVFALFTKTKKGSFIMQEGGTLRGTRDVERLFGSFRKSGKHLNIRS